MYWGDCCACRSWSGLCFTRTAAQERGLWHLEVMDRSPVSAPRLSPPASARSSLATWQNRQLVRKTESGFNSSWTHAAQAINTKLAQCGKIDTSVCVICFLRWEFWDQWAGGEQGPEGAAFSEPEGSAASQTGQSCRKGESDTGHRHRSRCGTLFTFLPVAVYLSYWGGMFVL